MTSRLRIVSNRAERLEARVLSLETNPPQQDGPDPEFPEIIWRRTVGYKHGGHWYCYDTIFEDQIAMYNWTLHPDGYIYSHVSYKQTGLTLQHQNVWELAHGAGSAPRGMRNKLSIDHRNEMKWDNRLANLRIEDDQVQCRHNAKDRPDGDPAGVTKNKLKGVWDGRYRVMIIWHNQGKAGAYGLCYYGQYHSLEVAAACAAYIQECHDHVDQACPDLSFGEYHAWDKNVLRPFVKAHFKALDADHVKLPLPTE